MNDVFLDAADDPTEIVLVETSEFRAWHEGLSDIEKQSVERQGFTAKPGQYVWLADDSNEIAVGWNGRDDLSTLGALPMKLPQGAYSVRSGLTEVQALGWGLGSYQFDRYKETNRVPAQLVVPDGIRAEKVANTCAAVGLARDLINTSAADMAPSNLAAEVQGLADQFGAECTIWEGDELLDHGCGAIHAVGRAADDPPRLADVTWGDPKHPKITIIGQGVTFDSGGLDIKPANAMRQMKKDMGGAATAIGLAYLVMAEALPVHLRLLIPTAENAIAGNAYRPGDVLSTHKGITVEIDNTDAEGRLLLCDALSLASDADPELIVDYATLTGSARSAVGTELAAMFCNSFDLAAKIREGGDATDDPVWHMPLHDGYNYMLDSKVADIVNSPASSYAGAITAGLFLQKFVGYDIDWIHFDIMAFNTRNRPGRPEGGEAMGLRAVYHYLENRYGTA